MKEDGFKHSISPVKSSSNSLFRLLDSDIDMPLIIMSTGGCLQIGEFGFGTSSTTLSLFSSGKEWSRQGSQLH